MNILAASSKNKAAKL